jgi:hypothetical protein
VTMLVPDNRPMHSRYQELGAIASALFALAPERLVFFRVDQAGWVAVHGEPAVLVVKDTGLPLLQRAAWVYAQVQNPGQVRVFWYTPAEWEAMHDSEFARAVRTRGEDVVLPPPAEPAGPDSCGSGTCGLCVSGGSGWSSFRNDASQVRKEDC